MTFRSWNRRAVAWVGGSFIAAMVALAAYDIVSGYQATVRDTGRELEAQARLIAEQTARSVQAVDLVLRHLSQQHQQGAFAAMSPRQIHNYLREQSVGLVQIEGLILVDPSGKPLASSLRYPLPPSVGSVASFPVFEALRQGHRGLYVDDAVKSPVDGAWVIPLARRLDSADGRFAGGVAARGRIEYFEQFYRNVQLDPATSIALMLQNGTLLARHPRVESALGQRFPLFDRLLAVNPGPIRDVSPIDGVERFAALKLVPDYPLAVVVTRDAAAALAPWRAQSAGTALRTLALSALAAALLYLLLRQLSRLHASEEQYREIFNAAADALVLRDDEARVVDVNPAFLQISGFAREEVVGGDRWVFAVPEMGELARDMHRRVIAGESVQFEIQALRKDGRRIDIEMRAVPIRHRGRPHALGMARDITAQKRAGELLRASEEQYRAIFNGAADALVVRDMEARVIDVNPAFEQMMGYSRDEIVGTRWTFSGGEPSGFSREVHRRVIAGESMHFELRSQRKDGSPIELEVRAVPLTHLGQPHTLGMARDITALKRAAAERARLEGQLLQAKKLEAIGTLAGGIAHDFNNILAAILGYGDMAQRKAPEGTPLRRHIDAVVAAGMRAKSLVERILAFSRSGMGERVAVDVQSVVAEALDLLAPTLPKHVRLERRLAAEGATVMGDATQIHQVVMNLCANAVQAMKTAGTLTVGLDVIERGEAMAATSRLARGRYLRLVVRDTGSGMAPQVLERIFDPFFTTREVGVGTGLGLSLVHGIVTELGGGIDVESKPGAGTTFTVYLPWSDAAVSSKIDLEEIPRGRGETILLVDDEEALVRLGEEMLAELGYEPVGFTSSAAALAAFRESPGRFDAVLSDEAMADVTGAELAKAIRTLRPGLPILLMSGYVSPLFAARARNIGVAEVLAKPLVAGDIARALASALRENRHRIR